MKDERVAVLLGRFRQRHQENAWLLYLVIFTIRGAYFGLARSRVPSQKHDVFVPSRGVSVDDWGPMVNKVVLWARDDQDVFDF
ncbi:hypothetical protein BC938DRAFT_471391 [Jimgerdemannia flammicorona]|uniref:Uncharacterized protein n=1 Tax=Jimgerdemannia flammicorona TaxID=994334 RepID=A0A433QUL3_9FUNG|nr:hypothetical protein BC938DRAFT_471391 [Jimgerdemannia flammicorona]